jgi:hypothetical protein
VPFASKGLPFPILCLQVPIVNESTENKMPFPKSVKNSKEGFNWPGLHHMLISATVVAARAPRVWTSWLLCSLPKGGVQPTQPVHMEFVFCRSMFTEEWRRAKGESWFVQ